MNINFKKYIAPLILILIFPNLVNILTCYSMKEKQLRFIPSAVYLGDNTYIENCIVESRDTIRANTRHVGEDGVKVVIEKNERYAL